MWFKDNMLTRLSETCVQLRSMSFITLVTSRSTFTSSLSPFFLDLPKHPTTAPAITAGGASVKYLTIYILASRNDDGAPSS